MAGIAAGGGALAALGAVSFKLDDMDISDLPLVILVCAAGAVWMLRDIRLLISGGRDRTSYSEAPEEPPEETPQEDKTPTDFFAGCTDAASVKARYRALMKIYHPDLQNGDTSFTKAINQQYKSLMQRAAEHE